MSQLDILKGDIDPLTKRIAFAAILTAELEKEGVSPVAGGNYAVELYTEGGYKAAGINLFAPADLLDKTLLVWGFEKEKGRLVHKEIGITVDLLGEDLSQDQLEHVNQVDVNGFPVYLLGVEDVIVAKLADLVHRGESSASAWVEELIEIHVNEIDRDYLKKRAEQEGVMVTLHEILAELGLENRELYVYEG